MPKVTDYTDQVVGRLYVSSRAGTREYRTTSCPTWNTTCRVCGALAVVPSSHLRAVGGRSRWGGCSACRVVELGRRDKPTRTAGRGNEQTERNAAIAADVARGRSLAAIGREHGLSRQRVFEINRNHRGKHVTGQHGGGAVADPAPAPEAAEAHGPVRGDP